MSVKVYTIHYNLKNSEGAVIDTSLGGEPLEFVQGSGQVVKGIEKALEGREPGQVLEVTVPPELAYGLRRDELVESIPKASFDGVEAVPGKVLQCQENGQVKIVKVLDVKDDMVLVDSNHPLAGFTLYFDIELISVRDANVSEVKNRPSIH
ncbi:MAG: peptidylprolyl isomerase [Hahellaceae bacterium]|nr:peptidylprolyl isomerase [Hahellaceae bacterium]MCP5212416.1 peptidylprolyl isomerase [Hahellaceae bacterium]